MYSKSVMDHFTNPRHNESVDEVLGGLPENKPHCSNLGADALHRAINGYKTRKGQKMKEVETAECYTFYNKKTISFCSSFGAAFKKKQTVCLSCENQIIHTAR